MASDGTVFGPQATQQIAKTVREVSRRMMNETPHRGRWQRKGRTGGGLTIRFRIVSSYFCGACYVEARVISVPYGVAVGNLPDVDTDNNNAVRIYDRTGCKFNEPPEDLVNRIGYATYMTPLEDGPCPDTIFSSWECIDLCCSEETCD
jgi:hypothetical protein